MLLFFHASVVTQSIFETICTDKDIIVVSVASCGRLAAAFVLVKDSDKPDPVFLVIVSALGIV